MNTKCSAYMPPRARSIARSLLALLAVPCLLFLGPSQVRAQGDFDPQNVKGGNRGALVTPANLQLVRLASNVPAMNLLGVTGQGPVPPMAAAAAIAAPEPRQRHPRQVGAVYWIDTLWNFTQAGLRFDPYKDLPLRERYDLMSTDLDELSHMQARMNRMVGQLNTAIGNNSPTDPLAPFTALRNRAEWISIYAEGAMTRLEQRVRQLKVEIGQAERAGL